MSPDTRRRRSFRGRRAQQREGAVMLIVLLIVLTATTLAATAIQSTQFELRSSGYARAALQTQYVSEAAAMTTLAWIDATTLDKSFMTYLTAWENAPEAPNMAMFGEPEILEANRASANRVQWEQQEALSNVVMPPLSFPGYKKDAVEDKYGSLGPRSSYVAGNQNMVTSALGNYVVDMYDCRRLSNTATAGYQVNQGGSGTMQYFQYYCVVTSRGRTHVPYPAGAATKPEKKWTVRGTASDVSYSVNRFTMAHDSRGSVITPPMSQ